jgi:hypothetical protein
MDTFFLELFCITFTSKFSLKKQQNGFLWENMYLQKQPVSISTQQASMPHHLLKPTGDPSSGQTSSPKLQIFSTVFTVAIPITIDNCFSN